jgi:hypothetical protein
MRIMAKNSGMAEGDGIYIGCTMFMFIIFLSLLAGAAILSTTRTNKVFALPVIAIALFVFGTNFTAGYCMPASSYIYNIVEVKTVFEKIEDTIKFAPYINMSI